MSDMDDLIHKQREMLEVISLFKKMIASQAWDTLSKFMLDNAATLERALLSNPVTKMDDVLAQEFQKGRANGIRFANRLPLTIIETFEENLKQLGDEDDSGNEGDADTDSDTGTDEYAVGP